MNLLKLFIPKDKAQLVTELESWTVTWYVKTGWSNDTERHAKVFIKESDALEFKKQLKESANFLGCWIDIEFNKN